MFVETTGKCACKTKRYICVTLVLLYGRSDDVRRRLMLHGEIDSSGRG
nr:MAG TPA: hypothetical protein [Caudoviricetes sp.]